MTNDGIITDNNNNDNNHNIIIDKSTSSNDNGIAQNIIVVDFSVKQHRSGKLNVVNSSEDRSEKVPHHHDNEHISDINASNIAPNEGVSNKFNITQLTGPTTLQQSISKESNVDTTYQLTSAESINVKTFIDNVESLSISMSESDNKMSQLVSHIKNTIKTIDNEKDLTRLREYVSSKLSGDSHIAGIPGNNINKETTNISHPHALGKDVLIRNLIYRNVETLLQNSLHLKSATQGLENVLKEVPNPDQEKVQKFNQLKKDIDTLTNSNDLNTITEGANRLAKDLEVIDDIDFLKTFKDYIRAKKADVELEWVRYNLNNTVLPVVLSKINDSEKNQQKNKPS